MERLMKDFRPITVKNASKTIYRTISKYLDKDLTVKSIRQRYLDYFIKGHNHNFVRSSPVVPFYDPTVAFVNAGMNQFKSIFLGTQVPQHRRVANSQKCIRVGGKHNDLNVVGTDGYHHTFFEMLGNWSFGDYFKKDACELAWNLLTQEYKIDKETLYVTYFNGDHSAGLAPDLECKEIWKSIGISENRILPFGMRENFWEMGSTGPCGPCTEIHVDLLGTINRSNFVNRGLSDLTELWNIVFIQYNRHADGSIEPLPHKHIDTGMGLERLTALLQGKISNYDTDVFTGIFYGIQKTCTDIPSYSGNFGEADWNNLDTSFRILADHARTIVVCLGDGVIPEQNQKLRRLMRKVFLLSETAFKTERGLLKEISNYVVESLGPCYPELERNIAQIRHVIDYEEDVYKSIRSNSVLEWEKLKQTQTKLSDLDVIEMPGLIAAYKEIKNLPSPSITAKIGFKLYDTFGLDERSIHKLSEALNLSFDVQGFRHELQTAKHKSREQALTMNYDETDRIVKYLLENNVPPTCNSHKYRYEKQNNRYTFEDLQVSVLKVISNGEFVDEIQASAENVVLLLDKSSLYSEAGGQSSDRGTINFGDDTLFEVQSVRDVNGYILHGGVLKSKRKRGYVTVNTKGVMRIDVERRLCNMRNHTATHMLNAALKQIKPVTCQKSSTVNPNYLNFDVGVFGCKLTVDEIERIEREINAVIAEGNDVVVKHVDVQTLLALDNVTLVPGEIYPSSMIRLVEVKGRDNFLSREPCCGTHVLNTSDLQDFCVIGQKSLGRGTTSLHAVTGPRARLARKNGDELTEAIVSLEKSINDNMDKLEVLQMAVTSLKQNLKYDMDGPAILPLVVKYECTEKLSEIAKDMRHKTKNTLREFVEMEIQNVLNKTETNQKYIVHYLACSSMLESISLQKATDMCHSLPVIVISYTDNMVKARCCVPKNLQNKHFDATKWLGSSVARVFSSACLTPRGQDSTSVSNMKSKRINIKDWDTLLKQSMDSARSFAEKYLT